MTTRTTSNASTGSDPEQQGGTLLSGLPRIKSLTEFQDGQQEKSGELSHMLTSFGGVTKGANQKELHRENIDECCSTCLGFVSRLSPCQCLVGGCGKKVSRVDIFFYRHWL